MTAQSGLRTHQLVGFLRLELVTFRRVRCYYMSGRARSLRPSRVSRVTLFHSAARTLPNAEQGPETCAVFDFDGTIISGYSATAFLKDQIARGEISR
jgi:hypothetical protein